MAQKPHQSKDSRESSIKVKDAVEAARAFPNVKMGSRGIDGARHGVIELIGNIKDEAASGFGDSYDLTLYEDGSISVRDYGRGIPLGFNEGEQDWNWRLIFCTEWSGGKYFDTQEILKNITDWDSFDPKEHDYLLTVGQHGTGASVTQMTSRFFKVISYQEGTAYEMEYQRGYPALDELKVYATDEPNGTYIHWLPDDEVFTDTNITDSWLKDLAEVDAYVAGMTVRFQSPGEDLIVYEASDIAHLLADHSDAPVSQFKSFEHPTDSSGDIVVIPAELALSSGGYSRYFHNQVEIMGGSMVNATEIAIGSFFKARGAEAGINFKVADYTGLVGTIVSSSSNKTNYEGQTKFSFEDTAIYGAINRLVAGGLSSAWSKGTPWLVKLVEQAIKNAEMRIRNDNLASQVKEIAKVTRKKEIIPKFASCEAYEARRYEEVELWICEGDSARGSLVDARDSRFQAILPVRGKSLNVLKASMDQILKNQEIRDLINILGCGVDLGLPGVDDFDRSNLKVGKIILGTDGDVDGYHIRVLLTLIIYKLFPQLLEEGLVYIAETPLYHLVLRNGDEYFCTDDQDLKETLKEVGQANVIRQDRFKGLGQVNPDILWDTTVSPATRNLVQVKVDPEEPELYHTLDVLFGKNTDQRKRQILSELLGFPVDGDLDELSALVREIGESGLDSGIDYERVVLDA